MLLDRLLRCLPGLCLVNLALALPASAVAAARSAPQPPPDLKVSALQSGLNSPWSLAFLPDGRMLVTERAGALKLLSASGQTEASIDGLPAVHAAGQGGLLDVALDPAFAGNQRLYFSYSESDATNPGLSGTAVASARLDLAARRLIDWQVIYRQLPKINSNGHFGSRLAFDRQGFLFVTLGDRQSRAQRVYAQDPGRGNGKVVRITRTGAPAPGNPDFGAAGAVPGLWSLGHRNPQGAAIHPQTGELWISEHGPQGGDEINRVLPGRNYGWPQISSGQEYGSTVAVGQGTAAAGMEPAVLVWLTRDGAPPAGGRLSSMAPSGLMFYTGKGFPEFRGDLFSGALAGTALWRIRLDGHTELFRQRLLHTQGERIRDVRQGPDGWIYLLTDSGRLLRLSR